MKYLKGLNTLRAIAALVVVFDHVEIIKQRNHLYNLLDNPSIIYPDGHLSVMLFYVISGFLITYLLLVEREKKGNINIRNFYIRRILRIWPLYYLIVFGSYFIFQPDYSAIKILLSVFIMPNVSFALNEVWDISPQIWSIGAEEQFYIFWPFLFLLLIKKNTIKYFLLVIISLTFLPYFFKIINLIFFQSEVFYTIVSRFFYGTKFNCLVIGGLTGFLYFKNRNKEIAPTKYAFVIYVLTLLPFVLWFFQFNIPKFNDEFYTMLFAFSTYQIVKNPQIKIDNQLTHFLGKISYGIYLYHWVIIVLLVQIIPKNNNVYWYNTYLYVATITTTITISWISYVTYERFFLKMKDKYTVK